MRPTDIITPAKKAENPNPKKKSGQSVALQKKLPAQASQGSVGPEPVFYVVRAPDNPKE